MKRERGTRHVRAGAGSQGGPGQRREPSDPGGCEEAASRPEGAEGAGAVCLRGSALHDGRSLSPKASLRGKGMEKGKPQPVDGGIRGPVRG